MPGIYSRPTHSTAAWDGTTSGTTYAYAPIQEQPGNPYPGPLAEHTTYSGNPSAAVTVHGDRYESTIPYRNRRLSVRPPQDDNSTAAGRSEGFSPDSTQQPDAQQQDTTLQSYMSFRQNIDGQSTSVSTSSNNYPGEHHTQPGGFGSHPAAASSHAAARDNVTWAGEQERSTAAHTQRSAGRLHGSHYTHMVPTGYASHNRVPPPTRRLPPIPTTRGA